MKPIRVQPIWQNEQKFLQYPPRDSNSTGTKPRDENIYHSLKFLFVTSNLISVLPQENVFSNPNDMKFTWKSWKIGLTFFFIILHSLAALTCLLELYLVHFNITTMEYLAFYASSAGILILYLRLANGNWSKFIMKWCKIDQTMNKTYGYPDMIKRKLWIVSIAFGTLTSIDFILSIMARYHQMQQIPKFRHSTEQFCLDKFESLFRYMPRVNILSSIYCGVIALHGSCLWGFNDLFIITLSIALALRFNQLLIRMTEAKTKDKSPNYWKDIREDFGRLSSLCEDLDSNISFIVLLSYAQNIFFLLIQLFHSLESIQSTVGKVYFGYSFLYLIIKVASVSLYAAWINDESKGIANILNSVPAASYNIEIRRLLTQIGFGNVALTGCKMYKITRGLILNLASAVVTYELVLIQFSQARDTF